MVDESPDHEALVSCHQRLRYTYRDLQTDVDRCARGFLALGLQRRDRIGLWMPLSAECVIAMLAGAKIGAELIALDPACGATRLHAALAQYDISLLIFTASFPGMAAVAMLGAICPELGTSPRGQLHSQTFPMLRVLVALGVKRPTGAYNWGDVMALGDAVRPVVLHTCQAEVDGADLVALVLNDEAGEAPGGETVSHQHLLSLAASGYGDVALTTRDRLCLALPLSHPLGMGIGTFGCLTQGATLILPAAVADPVSALTAIQEERCTVVLGPSRDGRLAASGEPDAV